MYRYSKQKFYNIMTNVQENNSKKNEQSNNHSVTSRLAEKHGVTPDYVRKIRTNLENQRKGKGAAVRFDLLAIEKIILDPESKKFYEF